MPTFNAQEVSACALQPPARPKRCARIRFVRRRSRRRSRAPSHSMSVAHPRGGRAGPPRSRAKFATPRSVPRCELSAEDWPSLSSVSLSRRAPARRRRCARAPARVAAAARVSRPDGAGAHATALGRRARRFAFPLCPAEPRRQSARHARCAAAPAVRQSARATRGSRAARALRALWVLHALRGRRALAPTPFHRHWGQREGEHRRQRRRAHTDRDDYAARRPSTCGTAPSWRRGREGRLRARRIGDAKTASPKNARRFYAADARFERFAQARHVETDRGPPPRHAPHAMPTRATTSARSRA